jgi:hypothetical protein
MKITNMEELSLKIKPLDDRVRHKISIFSVIFFGVLISFLIFFIPSERITAPIVDLFSALIWPYTLLLLVVIFRHQAQDFIVIVLSRIKSGSSIETPFLKLGGIPYEAERIPIPSDLDEVTLENIALLHTSFLSTRVTARFNNGKVYYQFEVIVIAPEKVMERIEVVTYFLENAWPEEFRIRTTTDRSSRFKMKDLANGTSIVRADVRIRGQKELLQLNRFIDLRPDGPRI